jgi:DNA-binding NtrC family response regulator
VSPGPRRDAGAPSVPIRTAVALGPAVDSMSAARSLTLAARRPHSTRVRESDLAGCSVLIVDDHGPHRTLLLEYLGALGCACDGASGGHEALAKLAQRSYDLVLLDLRMDDLDGMEVLKRAQSAGTLDRCIMMSAEGTILHALEAIRLGAKDFLVKPFELEQLHEAIGRVVDAPTTGHAGGRDPRLLWRDTHAPKMIGEHSSLLEVFLVLERIAHTDCTVLVTGESGTGKELVARALHDSSPRCKKPFIPVNCGAIAETLIESELFGHARGAFSGATTAREGRFAAADAGTLFLDEIGEMSLAVQVKFLRVLQEKEYVPVGETRPRKCDVRIVAATHQNLERMAEEGRFRADLFYRLNLIPIHLPSLRERPDDIPRLTRHFIERMGERGDVDVRGITDEALALLTAQPWPGNVRELENTVERMTLLHQGDGILTVEDLPAKFRASSRTPLSDPATGPSSAASDPPRSDGGRTPSSAATRPEATDPPTSQLPNASDGPVDAHRNANSLYEETAEGSAMLVLPEEGLDLRAAVEAFEMGLIDQALERTGGNKNQASILLGMNRTTLVEKLRKRRRKADAES